MGLFLDKIVPLLKENGINCVEAQGLGEVLMELLEEHLRIRHADALSIDFG
jgi:hypothetical protein